MATRQSQRSRPRVFLPNCRSPGRMLKSSMARSERPSVRQHPKSAACSGHTANTVMRQTYGDAWSRLRVSIQCSWGLALAHRRLNGAASGV